MSEPLNRILEVYTGPPTRDRERVGNNLKRKDVEFVTEGNLNTRKATERKREKIEQYVDCLYL